VPTLTLTRTHGNHHDLHLPTGTFAGTIEIIDGAIESFAFTPAHTRERPLPELVAEAAAALRPPPRPFQNS
jgi:hypothetical protein